MSNCWPEQDAVYEWCDRVLTPYGLSLSIRQKLELSEAVSVERIRLQRELEELKAQKPEAS